MKGVQPPFLALWSTPKSVYKHWLKLRQCEAFQHKGESISPGAMWYQFQSLHFQTDLVTYMQICVRREALAAALMDDGL